MAQMDRDVLFAVLAVQLGFTTATDVLGALSAWLTDRTRSVPERLAAQGSVTEAQRKMIEGFVDQAVESHGGSVHKVVETLGGERAVLASFGGRVTLEHDGQVSVAPRVAQQDDSSTSPTAVSQEEEGRYRFEGDAEVGRGGIGRILVAFDTHLGREIAVKELLGDTTSSTPGTPVSGSVSRTSAIAARFLREARVTGQLEHPSIVPVHEVGQRDDGTYYYTMKLVRGRTLSEALKACRTLGERLEVLPHYVDLCQAVAYAHSRGVIHRDIKPANVMVGEFGETVVLDWGLAKVKGKADIRGREIEREIRVLQDAQAGKTIDGSAVGTPAYMSPEQADGAVDEIDERSDVWSLGAVLFEVLTGRPPFEGVTAYEIIGKVLKDEAPRADEVDPVVPPELAAVCAKALNRDPAARYQQARALASEIEAYLSGALVGAYAYGTWEQIKRIVARHKAVTALVGVLVVVLLGGSMVLFEAWRDATEAMVAATEARQAAEEESRVSQGNLALALAEKAAAHNGRNEHLAAAVFAAKALAVTPYNERNDNRFQDPQRLRSPEAEATRVAVQSSLHDALVHRHFSFGERHAVHQGAVTSVAFDPSGKRIASVGQDGKVVLSNLEDGDRRVLESREGRVRGLAWSRDGRRLATARIDGTVTIWSTDTAEKLGSGAKHEAPVLGVAFSPDDRLLASADVAGKVAVGPADGKGPWSWREGRPWNPNLAEYTDTNIVFTKDGAAVAVPAARAVRLVPVSGDGEERILPFESLANRIALNAEGSRLAAAGSDHRTRVWRLADGEVLLDIEGERADQRDVLFTPDGALVAVADDGRVLLWDSETGRRVDWLAPPGGYVQNFAVSPDGKLLALGLESGAVSLWRFDSRPEAMRLVGHTREIIWPAWTPDGTRIVSGSWDGSVRVWDLEERREVARLVSDVPRVWKVEIDPAGKRVAFGDLGGTVDVWDLTSYQRLARWKASEKQVRAVAWSPDGRVLATAGMDGQVRFWDAAGSSLPGTMDASSWVWWMEWSADGRRIVTGARDGHVRVFDVRKKTLLHDLEGHASLVSGLDVSPDGTRCLSASKDGTVRVWDLDEGREVRVFEGHKGWVNRVALSPDGRWALSTSDDGTGRLWQAETGRTLQVFDTGAPVVASGFSPDGRSLIYNDGYDLEVVPFWPDLWEREPREALERAEKAAGVRLDGLRLLPSAP